MYLTSVVSQRYSNRFNNGSRILKEAVQQGRSKRRAGGPHRTSCGPFASRVGLGEQKTPYCASDSLGIFHQHFASERSENEAWE